MSDPKRSPDAPSLGLVDLDAPDRLARLERAAVLLKKLGVGEGVSPGHGWLRERVLATLLPDRESVLVEGPDAPRFLQGLLTNDVVRLGFGEGCRAALLDVKGKMQCEMRVSRRGHDDGFLLDVPGGSSARLVQMLDRYLFREKVQLTDRAATHHAVLIAGPALDEAAEALGIALPEGEGVGAWRRVTPTWTDLDVDVCRSDAIGAGHSPRAVVLWWPTEHLDDLLDRLVESLKSLGGVASSAAVEQARIEAGVPRFGADCDAQTIPLELPSSDDLISFTKGCYLGQEIIARVDARGAVNKHLIGVVIEGLDDDATLASLVGAALTPQDGDAGRRPPGSLTSVGRSPASGRVLGLARVKRGHQTPGNALRVEGQDPGVIATVTTLPFEEASLPQDGDDA